MIRVVARPATECTTVIALIVDDDVARMKLSLWAVLHLRGAPARVPLHAELVAIAGADSWLSTTS